MELVLVRHSISVANHADLISGADADVPLSDAGVAYAQKVRDAYDWQQFDAVYASPLSRAQATARILTADRVALHTDKRLEEMHFGQWEGLDAGPFRIQHPDAFDYAGMFDVKYADYAPESESYPHLIARTQAFLADLKHERPGQKVLLVCHGMTIRAMLAGLFGIDAFNFTAPANVALTQVELDEISAFRPRLITFNEVLVAQ